ncbi:Clan SC, family S33, methylesterase-like serine peptidase [Tritrichomonas foetus]|uniref:Protein phosphatase methylesterase 1 n=1 Tax=Tritrichomonas foetus TaxID=1144522 RepID=A0A1J4K7A5_9EUKA|nr:Clan SC, family S33, methylesterase-like serine peptidase [Tritrichomonas foetus]|eukprot:OHT07361.1 Clan SC, family S33, methylesterase-like serine peptidase [Tritrichomonas foetus]
MCELKTSPLFKGLTSPEFQNFRFHFSMSETTFTPWSKYWDKKEMIEVPGRGSFNTYSNEGKSNYVIVCVHGAGHSALSFSLFASLLKGAFKIFAYDLKCHGDTPGDESKDLGINSLVDDLIEFCKVVQPENTHLIVMGHSLGGSIAARAALSHHMSAVIVIDTIEGTATGSMPQMKNILLQRPSYFDSPSEAIEYIATSGEMMNFESAAVSAQGRFKTDEEGRLVWRTDLIKCEKDWMGWFEGFADAFLKSRPYKVLVLPDINRLDTPFTIGHMSGKFQLEVILETNHCIHEDQPNHVASMVVKLVKRLSTTHQWD